MFEIFRTTPDVSIITIIWKSLLFSGWVQIPMSGNSKVAPPSGLSSCQDSNTDFATGIGFKSHPIHNTHSNLEVGYFQSKSILFPFSPKQFLFCESSLNHMKLPIIICLGTYKNSNLIWSTLEWEPLVWRKMAFWVGNRIVVTIPLLAVLGFL